METSERELIKKHANNPFICSSVQLGVDLNLVIAALETAQAEKGQLVATLRAWEKTAQGGYHEALEDVLSLFDEEAK